MRPFQWVKNIILFLPMFFAQEIGDTDRLWNVAILFAGFCLLTSGVYIFNDLMEGIKDRNCIKYEYEDDGILHGTLMVVKQV